MWATGAGPGGESRGHPRPTSRCSSASLRTWTTAPSAWASRIAASSRSGTTSSSAMSFRSTRARTRTGLRCARLWAKSYPHLAARLDEPRMVLVCGPRVDPDSLDVPSGVEVRRYVDRLHEHLAACDVAIVQAGGTTTLELTALRRPFIYFPLENHFEQNVVVAQRLARHRAGVRMRYSATSPERLADEIVKLAGSDVAWPPIPSDGANRSAELISRFL